MENLKALQKYLPNHSFEKIADLLKSTTDLSLNISRERKTKWGDYRYNPNSHQHTISINYNLNAYSFLLTLLHEFAHYQVQSKYGRQKPHGDEWKQIYRELVASFLSCNIFPSPLEEILSRHIKSPKAAITADVLLYRELKRHDSGDDGYIISDLPDKTVFRIQNGEAFKKIRKIRTRYECVCIKNNKKYIFSPFVPVFPFEETHSHK